MIVGGFVLWTNRLLRTSGGWHESMLGSSAHTLIGLSGAGDVRVTTAAATAIAVPPRIAKYLRTREIYCGSPVGTLWHRGLAADPQRALRLQKLRASAVDLLERVRRLAGIGHRGPGAGQ